MLAKSWKSQRSWRTASVIETPQQTTFPASVLEGGELTGASTKVSTWTQNAAQHQRALHQLGTNEVGAVSDFPALNELTNHSERGRKKKNQSLTVKTLNKSDARRLFSPLADQLWKPNFPPSYPVLAQLASLLHATGVTFEQIWFYFVVSRYFFLPMFVLFRLFGAVRLGICPGSRWNILDYHAVVF